jgi:hypothetical protein
MWSLALLVNNGRGAVDARGSRAGNFNGAALNLVHRRSDLQVGM